jgi:hypothetical protein
MPLLLTITIYKGVFMSLLKKMIVLCLLGIFLTACGEGGVFGNNPGPKKPAWANQTPEKFFN